MNFAERLKELRKENQCTQKQLANYLGLTPNSVCEWENSRSEPSIASLSKIAAYFEVSVDFLIGNSDDFGNIMIEKNTPQLTAEEWQLVEDFCALSVPGKQLIKTTMKTLLQTSEAVKNNKKGIS